MYRATLEDGSIVRTMELSMFSRELVSEIIKARYGQEVTHLEEFGSQESEKSSATSLQPPNAALEWELQVPPNHSNQHEGHTMATAKAKKVDETASQDEVANAIAVTKAKREPDTSPVGLLLTAVRNYRKASRVSDPSKIEAAREDERQARAVLAQVSSDPNATEEQVKEATKARNRAAGRIDRMKNKHHERASKQLEALDKVQAQVDAIRAGLEEPVEDDEGSEVKH